MYGEQNLLQLSEVRLKCFKAAFKPAPIDLKPFNVIIGRNGSGKSTLLEALQWIDTTQRRDAREACDRTFGVSDLINLRSQSEVPSFELELRWQRAADVASTCRYRLRVEERSGLPSIAKETLDIPSRPSGKGRSIKTFIRSEGGHRLVFPDGGDQDGLVFTGSDRSAMGLLGSSNGHTDPWVAGLQDFWSRAVFLRLSPNRLAQGSSTIRKSYEPLLDEEGQTLPALLNELDTEQREDLVAAIRQVLPGIRGVEVSEAEMGRDTRVHYSLLERMPFRGRSGRSKFPIPAWMLSEGTRRITAILALLMRRPSPSLLCIEEIENGLDPWTVLSLLKHLQSAADRGVQILLTTHSVWLLDHVPLDSILHVRRIDGETRYERFASREEVQAFHPTIPPGTRYVHTEEP